jgi:hypothetical protein
MVKPPPPVEDSNVSDGLSTLTETESDSGSPPYPVHGIRSTLPVPKVVISSKLPPAKPPPWMAKMAPTARPPSPPAPNVNTEPEPVTPASLADTIHSLRDLIFRTALPKTDKAKNVTIAITDFRHARNLIASACASLQTHHHDNLQLNDIAKKLDAITAHLDIPNAVQPPQPRSYASVLATGIKPPVKPKARPGPHLELTLAQVNRARPALADLSNDDLAEKINAALVDTGCFLKTESCDPIGDRTKGTEYHMPRIRAVGRHHSGDIWLATYSAAEHDFLAETARRWVPRLSDQLSAVQKTYPILVHGIPFSFDPSRDGDDVRHLITQNGHLIPHPSALQRAEFLPFRNHTASPCKAHGSLVIHFTEAQAANDCITHYIAYQGRLLPTVKFTRRPPQCYNCHSFGHLARACKAATACGCCAGAHATRDCRCPAASMCTTPTPSSCRHVQLKCAACMGPHPASSPDCPARRVVADRHMQWLIDDGPFYA